MIIPSHQELAQLVARNVSSVGDTPYSSNCGVTMCCGRPLCEINMYLLFFFVLVPWLLIISLAQALFMPRNLVAFFAWTFTFFGVAFTLKRRDVRMSDAKAEELRAFFRVRGFGLLVQEQGFFARRRSLSLSAGCSAAIVASAIAYAVWGVGGLLGYRAHP